MSNLSVAVTADVVSLKAQMAVAKAELSGFSAAARAAAQELAGFGPPTANAASNLLKFTENASRTEASIKSMQSAIRSNGAETDSVFAKNRASFMELEHSGRAVADGLAAGASPIRLLAMESARLGQAYANLDAAGKAAVMSGGAYAVVLAAVAAAAGVAIGQLLQMHNAIADIQSAYAELGNGANFSAEQQRKAIEDIRGQFHLWQGDAITIAKAMAGIPNITEDMRQSLMQVAAAQYKLGDASADEVAKKLVAMFSSSAAAAVDYAIKLGLITGAQTTAAKAAVDGGDRLEAFRAVIAGMVSRDLPQFEDHLKKVKQLQTSVAESISNAAGAEAGIVPETTATPSNLAPDPTIGKQADDPATQQRTEIANKLNQALIERQSVTQQVADMQALLDNATQNGTEAERNYAQAALDTAKIKLAAIHTPEEIQAHEATLERIRSEVAATQEGSTQRVAATRRLYDEMKSFAGGDETAQVIRAAAQVSAVEREAADQRLKIRMNELASEEGLAKNDFDKQRALVQQEMEMLREAGKTKTDEYRAAGDKMAAIDREQLQQKNAMTAEWASTQAQASKTMLVAEKDRLDAEVTAGKMSNQQKYDALRDLADREYQLDANTIAAEYVLLDRSVEDQLKTYDKLYQLGIQHNADMAKLSRDLVTENQKDAKTQQQAWDKTNQEIARSASSSVMSMLKGQQSFTQSAIQLGDKLLEKGLTWAIQKAMVWAESEMGMTAATAANQAAQIGMQETGQAVQAASQTDTIANNAYTAASGAYSAVAGIPYVGPVLAPIAAAAAFAGVMAFDVISASGGMGDVPGDDMPALLHKREMVLPAPIATMVRGMAANSNGSSGGATAATAVGGSSGSSGGSTGGDVHLHAHFDGPVNGSDPATLQQVVLSTLDSAARNGVPSKYSNLKRVLAK